MNILIVHPTASRGPLPESPDLTLVLPLYNEGASLSSNLDLILRTLNAAPFRTEILLIDDGSHDRTPIVAKAFAEQHAPSVTFIQHERNAGRGGTVMDGFRRARGRVVGFIDVDCEASPEYIVEFVPDLLADRYDAITGLRVYPFSVSTVMRAVMSISYRWLVRLLLRVGFRDRQSGYKFFRRDRVLPLLGLLHYTGWFWDTEIMVAAAFAGLRIEERSILFLRDPRKKSTVRLWHDSFVMLWQLLLFRRMISTLKQRIHELPTQPAEELKPR